MAINQTILNLSTSEIEILEVDTIAGDKYIYKITDIESSAVLYENSGYATDDSFSSPDGTATGITLTVTLTGLETPTAGGDIQISSKRLRSSVTTTTNYPRQKTLVKAEVTATTVYDCVAGTMKLEDTTTYPSGVSDFQGQTVFHYPNDIVPSETVTSKTKNDTYFSPYLYTQTTVANFSAQYVVLVSTSPYNTYQLMGGTVKKSINVECNKEMCDARCLVNEAYNAWLANPNAQTFNNFIQGASILTLIMASQLCGKDITGYINQLKNIYGDCGCGCSGTSTPVLIRPCICN